MIALLLLYVLLFCIMYYTFHAPKYRRQFPFIKLSVSLCFVAIAVLSAVLSRQYPLLFRMLPAFLLAALGDFLLGLARSKDDFHGIDFLLGVGAFLAAHISFYLAFITIVPVHAVDFIIPLFVSGAVILLSRSRNINLDNMKFPGIIYSFFVGLLFSKALMIVVFAGVSAPHLLILTGSFLFLASDLVLLFLNFHVSPPKCLAFVNLSTYYMGIALLGLSLYPF